MSSDIEGNVDIKNPELKKYLGEIDLEKSIEENEKTPEKLKGKSEKAEVEQGEEQETEDKEIKELQEKGIIDLNSKNVKYYTLNQSNLEELGLSNIKLEEGFYIVDYNSNEIIYSKGVENQDGNRLYKLSEFQK